MYVNEMVILFIKHPFSVNVLVVLYSGEIIKYYNFSCNLKYFFVKLNKRHKFKCVNSVCGGIRFTYNLRISFNFITEW